MNTRALGLFAAALLLFAGCNTAATQAAKPESDDTKSIVLINLTSDAAENPQSVDMAMKLAGFALDEGRYAVIFFNVKGVTIPTTEFPDDFAWQDNEPIKTQLNALIERGVEVHVCPICMKALGVEDGDIIEGAQVTTKPKLFSNIGPDTAVFTY